MFYSLFFVFLGYAINPEAKPTATAQANIATADLLKDLMIYLIAGIVVIIVVIAIGFALVLRKRSQKHKTKLPFF